MPRRGKSSPAEDMIDVVALMPWWAGVALAAVIYLILHSVATSPLPTVSSPTQVSSVMVNSVWRGLAYGGQYILPFICLLGALVSFLRRRKRQGLYDGVKRGNAADALERMSWREFEMLVGEGFRQRGYAVQEPGGGGADGGVDLVLRKDGETFLVQCKQWKALKVSVSVVRELYGVMAARGAAGGFVVTSGAIHPRSRSLRSRPQHPALQWRGFAAVDSKRSDGIESGPVSASGGAEARCASGARGAGLSDLQQGDGASGGQTGCHGGQCFLGLHGLSRLPRNATLVKRRKAIGVAAAAEQSRSGLRAFNFPIASLFS